MSRSYRLFLYFAATVAACVLVVGAQNGSVLAPSAEAEFERLEKKRPLEIIEFRMDDFEHGWMIYSDGTEKVTADGGATWRDVQELAAGANAGGGNSAEKGSTAEGNGGGNSAEPSSAAGGAGGNGGVGSMPPESGGWSLAPAVQPNPETIEYNGKAYPVKQSQFLSDRIGWALIDAVTDPPLPPLITVDGGRSWHAKMTGELQGALQAEKRRGEQLALEAALFANPEQAKEAMSAEWSLMPKQVFVGDAVLVRHNKPGEVEWQGKRYSLQPFGSGYYTYLPVSLSVKPGEYKIGGAVLTVREKSFKTQYLQVSQQMEAMRRDTARIQADQKKIDEARSRSAPEFLFTSAFIQPIEGILTTPYGYTRYVNGKWDSSHTAIDLAAKQGTPIQATNDGIVALADSLYLTGNSIYIDHGMGVFSQYAHLAELHVKAGDRVKKGDIIGTVGSTGFSTGPHLHFTFWIHNVPSNPNRFFGQTPFHWFGE